WIWAAGPAFAPRSPIAFRSSARPRSRVCASRAGWARAGCCGRRWVRSSSPRSLPATRCPSRATTPARYRRSASSPDMRPDITSLALFIRVAELKSITKAANASHIALAAASRRIAQLEDQLGVHLLFRSARGVELTPAGTALLQHARDMMARLDSMRVELSDYA